MRILIDILLTVLFSIPAYWLGTMVGAKSYLPRIQCPICDQRAKIAWYTFRVHRFVSKMPKLGKWIIGAMAGFWYSKTIREGITYGNTRSTAQTKMPGM
jgi:hypothetical protein